jgi:hypothetical protein
MELFLKIIYTAFLVWVFSLFLAPLESLIKKEGHIGVMASNPSKFLSIKTSGPR